MNLTKHWAATLDDYVIDLAWSPDGTLLAAASGAGPVSVFATADGAKRHELPGHENGTNCLAWQPVGRVTASAVALGEGRIPNAPGSTSDTERRVKDNPPYLLATGGQDGAVKLWDATAGQHITTAKLGSTWVEHLAWQPLSPAPTAKPGSTILAAAAGRQFVFLNPDGSILQTVKPTPKTITALAWEPAGGSCAVAFFGGVNLWEGATGSLQKEFAYNNGIHALVWSPDGKWLVSGNQDPSVHLWTPADDGELHMSGYESKVKYLSFDHTSRWLATGGGRDACLWDCAGAGPEGREPAMFPHDAPVCAVAFQHGHGLLATAAQDGVVMLWSPERKQPLRATVKMPVAATKLAWSPDDRYLAIGSEKGAVYVLKAD